MSKIVFSQTDEFKNMREVITDTLSTLACQTVGTKSWANKHCDTKFNDEQLDYMYYKIVDIGVEGCMRAFEHQFPDFCFGDTATRDAATHAVSRVLDNAEKLSDYEQWDYIRNNIDCSELFDDLLHMYTSDSDIYEYEGDNALFNDEF